MNNTGIRIPGFILSVPQMENPGCFMAKEAPSVTCTAAGRRFQELEEQINRYYKSSATPIDQPQLTVGTVSRWLGLDFNPSSGPLRPTSSCAKPPNML